MQISISNSKLSKDVFITHSLLKRLSLFFVLNQGRKVLSFPFFLFYFLRFIYLLVVVGLCATRGFSLVAVSGAYFCCGAWASHCGGFLVVEHGLQARRLQARRLQQLWALEHRLSSCGTRALLPHGMWDLPRPGIRWVSLILQGRYLTTGPPVKPLPFFCHPLC